MQGGTQTSFVGQPVGQMMFHLTNTPHLTNIANEDVGADSNFANGFLSGVTSGEIH